MNRLGEAERRGAVEREGKPGLGISYREKADATASAGVAAAFSAGM
jgi:hypothetical protein